LAERLLVVFILWSDENSLRYQHEAIVGFHITAFRIDDPSFQGLAEFPLLKAKSSLTIATDSNLD
jgi:hypothetical protein